MPYADIEKRRQYARAYRLRNLGKLSEYQRLHRKENPEKVSNWVKRWRNENRDKFKETRRKRFKKDINFRIKSRLRRRLVFELARQSTSKTTKTTELLGCSIPDFRIYIESRFEVGMTWENYGSVWHIDHIMPCAIFDLSKPEHQRRCFHFSNLQPLFASENLKKGSKVTSDQYGLL